ncbi:DUF4188 domain-containing protein [Staphylococcus saprophyticus]|uniref:DUF4188 domain-containing protein n=1 Tax=Staphylococcus saprophyticus TaxID=29385 RepID=UPI000E699CB1|nr:DUF4188 domain-containing protein [Staphylococcus saprophyticus]MDW3940207.1 DUF4188 domain-containing protein [Staphylococcus saprophyticus]MDW4213754.1 DUF4188 domain-containing protein [Staphylococcus saprophyticus]MDW4228675.1 DUF4188 domain-containing protein [Staphylococcus saprophyticus]MDW4282999.1 DUF4188 domain-containing protein [Staphylococcus saprophyticus]MDW4301988.1 DUF4188 domain-containing protein [Staphylococcus saprophyticus]
MNQGRYTVLPNESVTVFLIGLHINKWYKVHHWLPVLLAMPPMLSELSKDKSLSCLSYEMLFKYRGVMIVQYWETNEKLLSYAKMPVHLKAWRKFSKKLKHNEAVGFYHETYNVDSHQYENIYINMPDFGLGKALGNEPVSKATHTAKQRLKKHT